MKRFSCRKFNSKKKVGNFDFFRSLLQEFWIVVVALLLARSELAHALPDGVNISGWSVVELLGDLIDHLSPVRFRNNVRMREGKGRVGSCPLLEALLKCGVVLLLLENLVLEDELSRLQGFTGNGLLMGGLSLLGVEVGSDHAFWWNL